MTIVRWDSSRDMAAHQERMSRMLEGFYGRPQEDLAAQRVGAGGRHLQQRPDELVLKAELPDMKEEEIRTDG